MSRRGVLKGPNLVRFETHSRRQELAPGRSDMTITAMTYLRAGEITVATKAQLLRALAQVDRA